MTLKTSSRKINPFKGMIKSTVHKNFGIIIVLCIAALLYCPGSFIVNGAGLYEDATRYGTTAAEFSQNFGVVMAVFAPLFVLLFNFVNFSFLFKKSASDIFHSFPLTRTELLLSRMISGIISAFIPIILALVCYLIIGIFNPWLCHFGVLFYHLAMSLVLSLLWSSFSLIFVVCAGSAFDLSLSFLGVNLAMLLIALIVDNIFEDTLLGYTNNSGKIYSTLSLPHFCVDVDGLEFWIRSIIYIAIFTAASIMLYNRRKAEKGGTAYAYKFMYYFCSVLVGLCGGYLIGSMFDNNTSSVVFWIFMALGAILCCLIYGLVTNRGFKGSGRSVLMGGIATVVLLAIMISCSLGGFGFSKRVPSAKMVKEAQVSRSGETITFTNPEYVINLHERVAKSAPKIDHSSDKAIFYFNYKLKNGTTLEREFIVNVSDFEKDLLALYKSDERFEMIKKETMLNESKSKSVEITYRHSNSSRYSGYITEDQHKKLLDLYWKEAQYVSNWRLIPVYENSGNLSFKVNIDDYSTSYFSLVIDSYFYETIEYIKSITQYEYYY